MAGYITRPSRTTRIRKKLLAPLAGLFVVALATLGAVSTTSMVKHESASADITNDIVCDGIPFMNSWAGPDSDAKLFGKDSVTYTIYRVTHTDDLHFAFESKSTVNSGTQDVDGLLNSFINWGRSESFTKTNERILGVNLTDGEPIKDATPNAGSRVTAYDRFGMAGLSWTRYNGEWRYPYVDICGDGEPRDLKLGVLYDGRLEPLTTYDGVKDTKDVRTAQFGNGLMANLGEGFLNTTANWTFSVTKSIVAVAIALVNISFSDFTKLLKLNDLIGGEGGVFTSLYKGIYQPFIGIVMVLVGLLLIRKGLIKREFRGALTMLFRSVALFMISIIVFAAPAFFVTLPNNAAVVLQSLVINAMSSSLTAGGGICSTDGSAAKTVETNPGKGKTVTDAKGAQDLLTKASENMRSAVGCQLWATFLVKPWSLGQFGADYNKLYAQGHIPKGSYGKTGEVKLDNESMVGDAAVPVGGDSYIYNWALYQISTETNAHAQTPAKDSEESSEPAQPSLAVYTNGIANDWYRIVDAMANYNEKETAISGDVNQQNGEAIKEVRYAEPDLDKKPTPYWSTWVGGNSLQRIGIAFTSILAAGAGLFTIVVFGFLSAIYGFGIIIVMAFAPIFLLMGSLGDRGYETFKTWGQLLLNLVMKRVMMGVILVLNLVILSTVLNMMSDQDYFWGVAALTLVSVILWKLKDKLIDTVGGLFTFRFADPSMESKASMLSGKLKGHVRKIGAGVSNVGVGAAVGGVMSARNGAGFGNGMKNGFLRELKTQAYYQDSMFMRRALNTYETLNEKLDEGELCAYCGQPLKDGLEEMPNGAAQGTVISDTNGNKWHMECAYEKFGGPDSVPQEWSYQQIRIRGDGKEAAPDLKVRKSRSHVDNIELTAVKASLKQTDRNGPTPGELIGEALRKDLTQAGSVPEIPEFLKPYLHGNEALIERALRTGDPRELSAVLYLYAQAIVQYAYENDLAGAGDYSSTPTVVGTQETDVQTVFADLERKVGS